MPVIKQRIPWDRQPQVAARIDPRWVSSGLRSVIASVGGDLMCLYSLTAPNAGIVPGRGTGKFGVAAAFTGTQSRRFPLGLMSAAPATRIAVIKPSTASGNLTMSGPDGGTNGLQFRLSNGVLGILNAGVASILSGGSVAAHEDAVVGCVYSNGRNELWKNGVNVASNTASGTSNANHPHYIGQRGSAAEFFSGLIYLHIDFSGLLSRSEMRELTLNPWQIFAP